LNLPFFGASGSGVFNNILFLDALRDLLDLFDGVVLGGLETPDRSAFDELDVGETGPLRSFTFEQKFIVLL